MTDLHRFIPPRQRLSQLALLALPVLIGLGVLAASARAGFEWWEVRRLTQTYTQLTGVQPDALSGSAAQREEMVKRMSSHRLIAPPPMQLTGVLGDQAIFNNSMMVKAGQSAGDMKVLSVGPNWVQVSKDGQEQKLWVFQQMSNSAPGPGGGVGMPMPPRMIPGSGGTQPLSGMAGNPAVRRSGAPPTVVPSVQP